MLERAKEQAFWDQVRTDPMYAPLIEDLKEQYQECCITPIEALRFSDFKLFYDTGSRLEGETPFFFRRKRLAVLATLYLIEGKEEYLTGVEDAIWAICGEFNWDNAAHLPRDCQKAGQIVALSSAETALALCEICELLKDRIDPMVVERVRAETELRIIQPYLNHFYWWDTVENNWAAVCAGAVGMTFMLHSPEKFPLVRDRILHSMDCYLKGLGDEGTCLEGIGYWNYGFSYFVFFADYLKDFTKGELDLFQIDKVRKVAAFQHKAFLQGHAVACFSDAGLAANCSICLTHYLHTVYPDEVFIPAGGQSLHRTDGFRWSMCIRNFVWLNQATFSAKEPANKSHYLSDAQWLVVKEKDYGFAAKGGHNDEPHNHNDVGTFALAKDGKIIMGDLGVGEYTKFYFHPDYRYGILVNGSQGHSVPIIEGQYQKEGRAYGSQVLAATDGMLQLECKGAYQVENLTSFVRTYQTSQEGIVIADQFSFGNTPTALVERMIALYPPVVLEGKVVVEGAALYFDAEKFSCQLSEEQFSGAGKVVRTCYFIDLIPKTLAPQMEFTFQIKIEA